MKHIPRHLWSYLLGAAGLGPSIGIPGPNYWIEMERLGLIITVRGPNQNGVWECRGEITEYGWLIAREIANA